MTDAFILPFAESDFQLWRHHPVSAVVLKYVADYADAMKRAALEQWVAGQLKLVDEMEMRGRVLAWNDIVDLKFEDIRSFYEGEKADVASVEAR